MAGASGKKLDETYKLAWVRGLKTTYYLRTLAATSAEKSTGRGGELNSVSSGLTGAAASASPGKSAAKADDEPAAKMCLINDPTCEACQ
jgi:ribonucleoside-diphosphate reductase alpha chain